MIPESKLNWSYEKPSFEEVEGKKVVLIDMCGGMHHIDNCDYPDYRYHFEMPPIAKCYAIIADPEPEPMELWGVKPDIDKHGDKFYLRWGSGLANDKPCLITPEYPTRAEANEAWNRYATALQGVER